MKISIQHEDITSYIEFEDFDIHDFATHLRSILHTVWLPEQVNEMMPTEESLSDEFEQVRELGYDEGYKEGEAANAKSAELIYGEGREEGYVTAVAEMRETYEPLLKGAAKDSERLDWLIGNSSISILRKDEDGEEWWVELAYSEPREDIDKAMEESQ